MGKLAERERAIVAGSSLKVVLVALALLLLPAAGYLAARLVEPGRPAGVPLRRVTDDLGDRLARQELPVPRLPLFGSLGDTRPAGAPSFVVPHPARRR